MSSEMQTKVQGSPVQNFTPVQTGLLQRKSSLCNISRLVEDSERDKEKLTLQRSLVDQAGTTTVPSIVHEVLHSPGQPLDPETRAYMEPHFGHDFSRVSVHSTGQGMIQTKLKINKPGDLYEQEADRVAEQVMRMEDPRVQRQPDEEIVQKKPVITPLIQRQSEEEEEEEFLQTKEFPGQSPEITPTLSSRIQSLKGGGQALPESVRAYFEPRFGYDFSQVRVHSDIVADQSAQEMNANAYTLEHNIVFGAGQFAPESQEGRRLIAHELTHVMQQSGADGIRVGQSNEKRGRSPILPNGQPVRKANNKEPFHVTDKWWDSKIWRDISKKQLYHSDVEVIPYIPDRNTSLGVTDIIQAQSATGTLPRVTGGKGVCPGYIGEEEKKTSKTETGHLEYDVMTYPRGSNRLLIADFGINWQHVKDSTKKDSILRANLDTFEANENYRLRIIGYSDCVSAKGGNAYLREGRAKNVYNLLGPSANKRIDFVRMAPLSEYVTDNNTVEHRAMNRGVVIERILPQPERKEKTSSQRAPEDCGDLIGSCDFYQCRERRHPCGEEGYYKGYGYKYCKRFSRLEPHLTVPGRDWVRKTLRCLQEHIDCNIPVDSPCSAVKKSAYDSHPDCYVLSGVCFLDLNEWRKILAVIDSKDNDLKQVLITGVYCVANWAPVALFPQLSLSMGGGYRGLMERDRQRTRRIMQPPPWGRRRCWKDQAK